MAFTVKYTTPDSGLQFEFNAENSRQAFEIMADVTELFPLETCQACKSPNVRPSVRTAQSYTFYEIQCTDCFCRLQYGQTREDRRLFPKRKTKDGTWLPNRGWGKYQANSDSTNQDTGAPAGGSQDVPW